MKCLVLAIFAVLAASAVAAPQFSYSYSAPLTYGHHGHHYAGLPYAHHGIGHGAVLPYAHHGHLAAAYHGHQNVDAASISHGVPHDTPEVAAAKIAHFAAHAEARARTKRNPALASQFHSQDAAGAYTYGYNDGQSSKTEQKGADGVTRGGYSYVDANGVVQTVNYIADPVHGFRVSGTNLPVGPHAANVHHAAPAHHAPALAYHHAALPSHHVPAFHHGGVPNPVHDTPEVAAAKAQHFAAVAAARALHSHV